MYFQTVLSIEIVLKIHVQLQKKSNNFNETNILELSAFFDSSNHTVTKCLLNFRCH